MEVMRTEIATDVRNEVPKNWKSKRLADVCALVKTKINPQQVDTSYKCIELEHLEPITGNLIDVTNSKNLLSHKNLFKEGDVLFGKLRPYLRKFFFADFTGICSSEIWVLRSLAECHNRYLYYLIQSNKVIEAANESTGTRMPRADWSVVSEVELKLPPTIQEQKAIATALSDVDALIQKLDDLIDKKQNIKKATMQLLLTGKKRLDGFDGEWVSLKLAEAIDVNRGGSPRPISEYLTNSADGVKWIKIGDTSPNSKYITSSSERIKQEGVSMSRRVYSGDLLLSNSMSFGRPYLLKIDGCIHDGWLVLQNYEQYFDTQYLYYLLSSKQVLDQYKKKAAGSSVLNLNKQLVNSIELNIPSNLEEQIAIAEVLSDIDRVLTTLQDKQDKVMKIKEGMMQELLTGKTRLL